MPAAARCPPSPHVHPNHHHAAPAAAAAATPVMRCPAAVGSAAAGTADAPADAAQPVASCPRVDWPPQGSAAAEVAAATPRTGLGGTAPAAPPLQPLLTAEQASRHPGSKGMHTHM